MIFSHNFFSCTSFSSTTALRSELGRLTIRSLFIGLMAGLMTLFTGCAAVQTSLSKNELIVNTKVSASIFVREVPRAQRTIYLKMRSQVADFPRNEFKQVVKESLAGLDEGYVLSDDPETATYTMNVNVISMEQASLTAAEAALNTGYNSDMAGGALAGGAVGAVASDSMGGAVGGAVLGAGISLIADSMVKDITFMLVTDILVTHKLREGVYGKKDTQIDNKAGATGSSRQTVSEVTDSLDSSTRIVTTANKANLTLAEASPEMFRKHSFAVAGFF
jgi:hypothetical protein